MLSISGRHSGSNISRQICTINSLQSRIWVNKVHLQVGKPKRVQERSCNGQTGLTMEACRLEQSTSVHSAFRSAVWRDELDSKRVAKALFIIQAYSVASVCDCSFGCELSRNASCLQRQLYHPPQGNFDESDVSPWPGSTDSVATCQTGDTLWVLQSSDSVRGRGAPRTTVGTPLFLTKRAALASGCL